MGGVLEKCSEKWKKKGRRDSNRGSMGANEGER